MTAAKSIFTDVITIRTFILHDALQNVPIFEGFKNLSEVVGDKNIDFPEYEFWYYRFLSGNSDIEFDRSSIPQPLALLDLPMDALVEIIGHLDVKNRLNARKVSKSFRDVIDSRKIDYSLISIGFSEVGARFQLNDSVFYYSEFPLINNPELDTPYAEKIEILDKNFQKMALKDLENVLKSTKKVQSFDVFFHETNSGNVFESFMKVMETTKFDVNEICIHEERDEEALKILSLFKPGKLESIALLSIGRNANLNKLVEIEQFKKAKEVDIERYGVLDFSLIDRFFGFDTFYVKLEDFRREDVIFVRNVLESSPNDRLWTFYSDNLVRVDVERAIDQSRVVEHDEYDGLISYDIEIPNSEYSINFLIREWSDLSMKKYK
ncbi:unnamed protein product [Caenorhabditis nigoni]